MTKYLITGASGQLGSLVIDAVTKRIPSSDVVAMVRSDEAEAALEARGITVHRGDYDDRSSLDAALSGIDRLLLISSPSFGQRVRQHANVIEAAVAAKVGFIAYTSLLSSAAKCTLIGEEHLGTESVLAQSGISHTLLRNGWYTENFLMGVPAALKSGQLFGASGEGRFSPAAREDYAEAAAAVLAGGHDGEILELGGDESFAMDEFAATLSELSGTQVSFVNIPEQALRQGMVSSGLPEPVAAILADADFKAASDVLYTSSNHLSVLIGRPTLSLRDILSAALAQKGAH